MASTSNRRPLRLLSVFILLVLAISTVGVSLVVRSAIRDQDRRLLRERANEAGLLLTTLFSTPELTLPLLAATTNPQPGSTELFARAADALRGPGTIGALTILDDRVSVLAVAGDAGADVTEERVTVARRAASTDGMVSAISNDDQGRQLTFAVAAGADRVLFQEFPLGLFDGYGAGADEPFSELDGVVYASDRVDRSKLVFNTRAGLDLSGQVERHEFKVGSDTWLLVAKANRPLVGGFAANAHWIVLAAGVVAALLATVLVETLGRRRAYALALVDERTSELREAVAEQERLEQGQRQARELAETANHAKSEFLSRMSHELRTPLNAVLGFGQLLELDELTDEQRESVQQIVKGGRHLLGLINEILDISRIEAGTLALSPEPVDFAEVIDETVSLLHPLADHRGIEIIRQHETTIGSHVLADRQRLKQVMLNLVANAVKYNVEGGTVAISCTAGENQSVRIAVADTGLGIDAGDIDKLFVPFERIGAERTSIEGAGIGLALSHRLVEAMSGTIHVESTLGAGSRFWVELPSVEGPVERYERTSIATPSDVPGADVEASKERHKILYIEDNLSNVLLVERVLSRRSDVEIVPAMQGSIGLALAREHHHALILLDLHLPDINGDEVLRQLRSDPATATTPIVVVSADATIGQFERLRAAGANAYLTKPLDVQELLTVISETLDAADVRA